MGLGTASVDGLISGLDTTEIIQSLAEVRRAPITLLHKRVTERTSALASYQSLTAQILALQGTASAMAEGGAFQARTAAASDASALLAYAGTGAATGTYRVTVDQLAQAQKIASGVVADADAALGYQGDLLLNGQAISLEAGDSLTDLRDAINHSGAGVSASILHVSDNQNRLILTSLRTGTANALELADANGAGFLENLGLLGSEATLKHTIANGAASDHLSSKSEAVGTALGLSTAPAGDVIINGVAVTISLADDSLEELAARLNQAGAGVTATVTSAVVDGSTRYRLELVGAEGTPALTDAGGVLQALGLQIKAVANELQSAQDARLYVDGYLVERSTNQVDDAIDGLSLDLLKADPGSELTLTVTSDAESAINAMMELVSSHNTVVRAINSGLTFDSDTGKGGVFFSDFSIVGIQGGLYAAAMTAVATLGGDLTLPAQLGLSVDENGLLALDAAKLRGALADDPDGVVRLVTNRVETDHDEVEYVGSTPDTADSGPSGFAVSITQAATRATAASAELADGIIQTETLTISGRYKVTLLAGDSLERAAEKLNAVFEGNGLGLTAGVTEGRLQVQSRFYGSHYRITIDSSLDQGAGGTDLGGATAGVVATYTGGDVQGTIGGQAAEGWGQWLTATQGAAEGLKLKITSTTVGDKGVARVSQGLASRISAYTARLTDSTAGILTNATAAVSEAIESLGDEINHLEDSVDAYTERLQTQFAAMEVIMAKNAALQSYLTSQISTLESLRVDSKA